MLVGRTDEVRKRGKSMKNLQCLHFCPILVQKP